MFWPEDKITKGDLLPYYADVSSYLLPHIKARAMVMKRYPDGAYGEFFFQKRAPASRPEWVPVCEIQHPSANLVDFPVINDLAGLLWVVNLGCIDLNPWYARCDDVDRPDYLHFDLDPTPGAEFPQVLESEYRVAKRTPKRVLVDYNQNSWGRTLASVYSVRPKPHAPVSAPVTWDEIERGIAIEDFRIDNMKQRLETTGELFRPLLLQKNRFKLGTFK